MICEKCKHTIEQPLELYNGEWACPDCKAKLGGVMSDFEITADNEQLFKLAECCYHNWLEGASRGEAERVREQLEKAIEFTREAAAMGNPEAVVRLGYYYDKDYTEVNKSEAARCRAAYAYYSAVCYASSELKVAKEGVKGVYDFRAIRIKAAGYLLKMLASAPEELTSSDKFNYENNLAMIKERLGVEFGIVDLSLAPTPAVGDSVADILEAMGLERCGTHGTTAALAMLNDAVKKGGAMASSHVGGLSGAFIPVSEDRGMIDAVECGALSIEKLEAMTSVCSVGLDMIAVPGNTPASTISAIIADEAAIGVINGKTTAVRIIPAYGKEYGDSVEFGGLLGYAPIMPVNSFSCDAFVERGGRIPAPIHSFKN